MTQQHRRWHFWIWLILAPALATGLFLGWKTRPVPVVENQAPASSKGGLP